MITINPGSINDLLALQAQGVPVTLTSHPGNASLYKLSLWACGIPDHLWDVTCAKADKNNWPMFELVGGEARLLVSESHYERVIRETCAENRFVTAYQKTREGARLGRHHVRVMQKLFPHVVKTSSQLLLTERENLFGMFSYLAETRDDVFTRFIDEDGVMRPIKESGIPRHRYAETFMRVLMELTHLLCSDQPISVRGGACYDGPMVALACMLVQYWQSDEIVRYDISGPDMIHYASAPRHVAELQEMLVHLRRWSPTLVPKRFHIHMLPGTVARVGYVSGHESEMVMLRKLKAATLWLKLSKEERRQLSGEAAVDGKLWPTKIDPAREKYFSQHDLIRVDGKLTVDPYWKTIPLTNLQQVFADANGCLRTS